MRTARTMALGGVGVLAVVGGASPLWGQERFILADRDRNAMWAVDDLNGDGVIEEPGELLLVFDATNAAGTPGIDNPTTLAAWFDGRIVFGDQGLRKIFVLRDENRDGDCQDVGESRVAVESGNASGVEMAFPTGAAFDATGTLYVANAGNAFGNDAVYKLVDLNGDGDYQDAGEIVEWVGIGAFGAPNGPYAPQEILFYPTGATPVLLLRNSSAGLHGVYVARDLDGNGRADDPGEFTVYWDASGQSGVTPGAGFALERDQARPLSFYTLQTATGSLDQLVRLTDLNGDLDAQDPGEAEIVFETSEAGFTAIDVVSLLDGRVLLTDNSGKRVIVLTDLDKDGRFTGTGERATYFANNLLTVGDIRQAAAVERSCQPNCDGSTAVPVLNVDDFVCFQQRFAAGDPYANCDSSTTPPVLNVNDFVCFQQVFAAGCP